MKTFADYLDLAFRFTKPNLNKPKLKCSTCGTTKSLIMRAEYVGGQGDVTRLVCEDSVACWRRWDEQNGFNMCPSIRRKVKHGYQGT